MAAGGFKGQPVCSDFSSDPAARCNLVVQNGSWNFSGWSLPDFLAAPPPFSPPRAQAEKGEIPFHCKTEDYEPAQIGRSAFQINTH